MGGAYHGWSDQLAYGMRVPGTRGLLSKGVPGFVFQHTDEFFPNALEDLERKLRANRRTGGTAAVYLEPMGPESGPCPRSLSGGPRPWPAGTGPCSSLTRW